MTETQSKEIGRIIGTESATPLECWVAFNPDHPRELDDVVVLQRQLPDEIIKVYGIITEIRSRHEGVEFDSDVFLIEEGVLPAQISEVAKVSIIRREPEVFVPPLPGQPVHLADGQDLEEAFLLDQMIEKIPVGTTRNGHPLYANFDFINGQRGAHINISGVSGIATKTSYATFLLYCIFHSGVLGAQSINSKALIFNVKGEDLLFLDQPNSTISDEQQSRYSSLELEAGPFRSVEFWAPPRPGNPQVVPAIQSRSRGVTSYLWSLQDFCSQELLPFLFADHQDERQQYTIIVQNVASQLRRCATAIGEGAVRIDNAGISHEVHNFDQLVSAIEDYLGDEDARHHWAGRNMAQGTIHAFMRRLDSARKHVGHLIRGDVPHHERYRINREKQLTVVDIHQLHDRAQRFVVGVLLKEVFDEKEERGGSDPLQFVVLDELNKYAPRDGSSPIKETLVDIAERGRSMGIILIGAQQTASQVERRVVGNAALRIVGRLDSAESKRDEYAFIPPMLRQRAHFFKPGTMILSQPDWPVPQILEFPMPAWATRAADLGQLSDEDGTDSFDGLTEADQAT